MGSFIELAKSKGVSNVKIALPVQRLAFSGDAKDYPDFVARLKSIYLPADRYDICVFNDSALDEHDTEDKIAKT